MDWGERKIFKYHDGLQEVYGDPLLIQGEIAICFPDSVTVVATIRNTRTDESDHVRLMAAWHARRRLCGAVREAFQMAPYDRLTGKGAVDAQCIAVWNLFQEFLLTLKKNGASPPTSPPSTASPPDLSTTPPLSA